MFDLAEQIFSMAVEIYAVIQDVRNRFPLSAAGTDGGREGLGCYFSHGVIQSCMPQ